MKYYITKINEDTIEAIPLVEQSNVEPVTLPKKCYKVVDHLVGEFTADICGLPSLGGLEVNDVIEIED